MDKQALDINEIMSILPHRYPFLLIDRVVEYKAKEYIIGIKNVTVNEPQFTGHFPNKPIMPGVLIVEAMAQLSALLVAKSLSDLVTTDKEILFMSIEGAKFRSIVQPGDTLSIHAKVLQNRGDVWKFSATAKVEDKVVSEGTFTAMLRNKD